MDQWQESLSLEIRRCTLCGHYWHYTQPDQNSLFGMYDASRPLKPERQTSNPSQDLLRQTKALYRMTASFLDRKPVLLDYGSGLGRWSNAAAQAGFDVLAYEPSQERTSEGDKRIRVVYRLSDIQGMRFDAIIMEQVLEHTQDPLSVMRSLRRFSYPHTIIRISVPNLTRPGTKGDWENFPFDGKTVHIMAPYEHLQGFTPSSLWKAIKLAGLSHYGGWRFWTTHPVYSIRRIVGRLLPLVRQTRAFVRFSKAGLEIDL